MVSTFIFCGNLCAAAVVVVPGKLNVFTSLFLLLLLLFIVIRFAFRFAFRFIRFLINRSERALAKKRAAE